MRGREKRDAERRLLHSGRLEPVSCDPLSRRGNRLRARPECGALPKPGRQREDDRNGLPAMNGL